MITIPKNKVAVIPVYDSEQTSGGIIKPSSFNYTREKIAYAIIRADGGKKVDEAEDLDRARELVDRYNRSGYKHYHRKMKVQQEDQPLDSGERCDQGVVKYVGPDVKDVKIGDYVFFSGYTGTLMYIEGEGKLIILPETFIECTFDIDKFTIVPGLYFKGTDGKIMSATYEQAMNVIAEMFTDLNKTVEVVSSKPKWDDYNVERN